jgi:hypothetical protein
VLDFVRRRLVGDVPLGDAFFYDMLIIGSLVNLAAGLIGLAMISADLPIWLAIATFLAPQPYNIVLLMSVWRSAAQSQARSIGFFKASAVVWFIVMFFV